MNRQRRIGVGRVLLFLAGLGLTGWLVVVVRTGDVWATLRATAPWLPLIVLFEIGLVAVDVLSIQVLVGVPQGRVPARTWFRGAALAYASSVLLPAGRAAGEAVRAAVLAPALGITRAAKACASLQACALVANAAISVVGASAARSMGGPSRLLALALCGNAVVCAVLATMLFAILENGRLGQWVQRRFPRAAQAPLASQLTPPTRSVIGTAAALCIAVRLLEAGEYGIILRSLGSPFAAQRTLTAQGIHLVGAAVGDFIPNQMGTAEGSYLVFAGALGWASEPARALSIALIAHIVQLGLAIGCLLLGAMMTDQPPLEEAL